MKGGEVFMKLPIRLDHFIQRVGAAQTGGHAKLLIQEGDVRVDGEIETRRRRMLKGGERIEIDGDEWIVSEKGT